jgi:transcriptional regulator with XRE-family HTH domain
MAQLAAATGHRTTAATISKIENGQQQFAWKYAVMFAQALGLEPTDLLDPQYDEAEKTLISLFRGLSDSDQQALYRVLEALAGDTDPKAAESGKK